MITRTSAKLRLALIVAIWLGCIALFGYGLYQGYTTGECPAILFSMLVGLVAYFYGGFCVQTDRI